MKKTARYIFALMLLGMAAGEMYAEQTDLRINDGNKTVILSFGKQPTVTFTDTTMVITAEDDTIEYPLTSTVTFDFIGGSGVEAVAEPDVHFTFTPYAITAEGLQPGETVSIYTYEGRLVSMTKADATGYWNMSTDGLPKQPLIVRTNQTAYKIIIR